jgi:acetyltransferase-like isoleucine patch superfamily enzyme
VLIRTIAIKLLQYRARKTLMRYPGVDIGSTAKVDYRRARIHSTGRLVIGEGSMVEGSLITEREGACIRVGQNTFIGNSIIAAATQITIGDDVLISWGCNIVDHNSHSIFWRDRLHDVQDWYIGRNVAVRPVTICNKVWIGLNVIILKGVEIGEGAVVAAGSVVTKSVPAWTVVAGNPARVIREISIEER